MDKALHTHSHLYLFYHSYIHCKLWVHNDPTNYNLTLQGSFLCSSFPNSLTVSNWLPLSSTCHLLGQSLLNAIILPSLSPLPTHTDNRPPYLLGLWHSSLVCHHADAFPTCSDDTVLHWASTCHTPWLVALIPVPRCHSQHHRQGCPPCSAFIKN